MHQVIQSALFIPSLEVTEPLERVTFSPSHKGHELNHQAWSLRESHGSLREPHGAQVFGLLNERAKKASGEAEAQVGDQKTTKEILGGGFRYCLCSPLVSEGFQFD